MQIKQYRKYIIYFFIFIFIITSVYILSISSFKKVEELVSYRFEINRIYEKWLVVKSDALSYLKSDKQENIKAKLNQSLELFNRDFLFFSRTEFDKLKQESPEIFNNSILLLLTWQEVQKNLKEILETSGEFDNFSRQIYWLSNDTVVFEQHLKELLQWFDSYNSDQLLFHWRTFYFFVVIIILSSILTVKFIRQYIHAKRTRDKTLDLMRSIESDRETERLKLALEIHDSIIQDLTFSRILCYDLHDSRLKKENQLKLDELSNIIMKTTNQIREITYDLMPPEVENSNVEVILSEYCRHFSEKTGIKTELTVTGFSKTRINKTQRLTIYRILQEALINVKKHSEAENVWIKMLLTYPYIIFRISDNGKGAGPQNLKKKEDHYLHIGLKGIQERVKMFDGEMNIKSIPGEGFTIGIKMKLMEEPENER